MNYVPLLLCAGLGLLVASLIIPLVIRASEAWGLVHGVRDPHHTHRVPVPRLGGLALAAAFLVVEIVAMAFYPLARAQAGDQLIIIFGALAMFALGFWDDLKPLGAKKKFFTQVAIAALVYAAGIRIESFRVPYFDLPLQFGWLSSVVTILWLVSLTNLINLVDGVDGLAGGICLMLMALLAYVGHQTCNLHLLAAGIAGGLAGFLWFNFPPARIYMGDGGAYFLGFLIGVMTIVSSQKGTIIASLIAPLFVLALPILDTTLAIVRRGVQGLPVFRPDRRHIHHRLMETGVPQRKIVLGIYALTALFLAMGFAVFWSKGMWIPNLLGLAVLVLLLLAGRLNFSREWFAVGRVLGNSLEMRQEVQYALSLTHWLALAGGRTASLEALWEDLAFTAKKLGFCYVRLTLEDGERVWQHPGNGCDCRMARREVLRGNYGTVELGATFCANGTGGKSAPVVLPNLEVTCQAVTDDKLFGITGELLAEGWHKAARRWVEAYQLPLRFSAREAQANIVSLEEARRVQTSGGRPE
jgi:UDP-GlcNAc:undecaprenyl-phosphate GlcNAc-1-phosphate transferase